jgi:DNA invertase Pin-like site-specific DNA recombinase
MYRDESKLDKHPREYWEKAIMSRVFDELARKAITRNFLDGIPYETVAEELGVSRDTIYNKIKKYSPKIFKGLK